MLTVGAYLPETAPHLKLIVHIEVKRTAENLNFWKHTLNFWIFILYYYQNYLSVRYLKEMYLVSDVEVSVY